MPLWSPLPHCHSAERAYQELEIDLSFSSFKTRQVSASKKPIWDSQFCVWPDVPAVYQRGRWERNFYYFKPSAAKNWHKHHISVSRCDVFLGQIVFLQIPISYKHRRLKLVQVSWFRGIRGMGLAFGRSSRNPSPQILLTKVEKNISTLVWLFYHLSSSF